MLAIGDRAAIFNQDDLQHAHNPLHDIIASVAGSGEFATEKR